MRAKAWLTGYFCGAIVLFGLIGVMIYYIDPYFHFHCPRTESFYYVLDEQRQQNDGITKHFDYDAIITGTSMMEQFKTSEMDMLFNTRSVKVPYRGASYKEVNDNLKTALKYHPELKMVIRGLDMNYFFDEWDKMAYEPEYYPTYLYNEEMVDDIRYFFNRDAMIDVSCMLTGGLMGETPGITSFDEYSPWVGSVCGINTVCPEGIRVNAPGEPAAPLSAEEKAVIQENIHRNVTSLAADYPDVTFYYFFPPYSAVWWAEKVDAGTVKRQIEAEQYIIELLLEYDNIRLYSFNNRTDITTDLNHYVDKIHYASWINSLMLRWMHDGEYLLTRENYRDYLEKEREFYTDFDYESLNGQEDYECDEHAAAEIMREAGMYME